MLAKSDGAKEMERRRGGGEKKMGKENLDSCRIDPNSEEAEGQTLLKLECQVNHVQLAGDDTQIPFPRKHKKIRLMMLTLHTVWGQALS